MVADRGFDWARRADVAPRTPLDETVIYEMHVKGFTQTHPDVPEEIRGTYAGLAHPAAIKYLTDLGVTAVELLPVQQFAQDSHLLEQGPAQLLGLQHASASSPRTPTTAPPATAAQQVAEFKQMVKALHAAGLEVILDVVYNHTAEGNHLGPDAVVQGHRQRRPTTGWSTGDRASYFDTTGTGNSLNVGHPAALGLIMDSLRYWVTEMHVDGFRFDLATTLTRQDGDADVHSAFLTLIHQDPVLAPVKMIAEPWDTAGLPGRRVPGRLVGVERQVPRRHPRLLGRRRQPDRRRRPTGSSAAPTSTRPAAARRCAASTSSPPTTASPWPT